jgi:integrase
VITYLTDIETQALLDAPDRATRTGRRDHALLALAVQTGLRATELISLTRNDIHLDAAHVAVAARVASTASPHSPRSPSQSCATG